MTCRVAKELAFLRKENFRQRSRITELEEKVSILQTLVHKDQLTGLYDKNFYLSEALPKFSDLHKQIAVIVIDLDGFKPLNDQYGHRAGDAGLIAVARVLEESIRAGDYAIRFGGDEFLLVLPRANSTACERICQKVKERISRISLGQTSRLSLSASCGYAVRGNGQEDLPTLVGIADAKMYHDKGRILSAA